MIHLSGVAALILLLSRVSGQGDLKATYFDDELLPGEDYFISQMSKTESPDAEVSDVSLVDSKSPPPLSPPEERLYKHLFHRGYVKNARPAMDASKSVVVKVGMCVMMIEDLIEREQMMIMAACAKMLWYDERLQWDPAQFNNLSWMAVPSDKVWLPDIVIVNSPNPAALTRKLTNVGLSNKGELGFFPSGRLFTRCNLIITYFPFDWQSCDVRFESWIYPVQYLQLDLFPGDSTIDLKENYENYQWNIKGHRINSKVVTYDGMNFSSVTVTFVFRRKSLYFSLYFIFPELLLAILQTLSHNLPVEHPGRMTMLTALFIGSSVTHAGVADHIPKSSDTMSLLQVYMTIMSVNLVFSLLVTFFMLYTALRYPNAEPSFVSMLQGFFSVIWPLTKKKPPKESHHIAELPEDVLPHYLRLRQTKNDVKSALLPKSELIEVSPTGFVPNGGVQNSSSKSLKDGDFIKRPGQQVQFSIGETPSPSNPPPMPPTTLNISGGVVTSPKTQLTQVPENRAFKVGHSICRRSTVLSSGNESEPDEFSDNTPAWEKPFNSDVCRRRISSTIRMAYGNTTGNESIMVNTDHNRKGEGRANNRKSDHRKTEAEALDLKRRWLMYCVALDKTIMYITGVLNITLPTVLFLITPIVNEVFFMSRTEYEPYTKS